MRRMRIGETLYSVYPCRIRANSELSEVARGNGSAVGLSDAAESLRLAIANLPELWAGRRYRQFATFLEIQSRLLDWRRAILEAEADADRYLRSAKLAARNLHTELRTESDNDDVLAIASSITGLSDVDEIPAIAKGHVVRPVAFTDGSRRKAPSCLARRRHQPRADPSDLRCIHIVYAGWPTVQRTSDD